MNLRENYLSFRDEAYAGLAKRDSKKWIRMLEAAPLFLTSRTRGRLYQGVYVAERILDDIADGDKEPPEGFDAISYLEAKQQFIREPSDPQDNLDYLFLYCYELANKLGYDISRELDAFFTYFLFDARRRGTGQLFSREELDQAYDDCDVWGTIRGSLMVFRDDPEKADLLLPLGRAVRIGYNLRDFEQDIDAGLVNIPLEDFADFGITSETLHDRFSPPVRSWFRSEAIRGLSLLDQHREVMQTNTFNTKGKFVLSRAHERPAQAYLEDVLANKDAPAMPYKQSV